MNNAVRYMIDATDECYGFLSCGLTRKKVSISRPAKMALGISPIGGMEILKMLNKSLAALFPV